MDGEFTPLHATEVDATNFLEWRDRIRSCETNPAAIEPRTYPGYPRWPLLRVTPRPWPPLERSLIRRRSATTFSTVMPSKRVLSRLLCLAHGIYADRARDRKSTRLNSSHGYISYAVFCLKTKSDPPTTYCPSWSQR